MRSVRTITRLWLAEAALFVGPKYRYTKTIPRNFSASSGKYPEYPGSERRGDGNIRKRKRSVRGMVLEYVEGGCRPWYRHRECYSV